MEVGIFTGREALSQQQLLLMVALGCKLLTLLLRFNRCNTKV
jgi:hypothetical protein